MQIVKILLSCLVIVGCSNTNEIQKVQTSSSVEKKIYKSKSGFTYLTLNVRDDESGLYHPATFLVNGILFHHFEKGPFTQSVIDGTFDIKVSYVSKKRYHIENLYISSGDSTVLDIKMEDDLSPLED